MTNLTDRYKYTLGILFRKLLSNLKKIKLNIFYPYHRDLRLPNGLRAEVHGVEELKIVCWFHINAGIGFH